VAWLRLATGDSELPVVFYILDLATNPLNREISGNYYISCVEIQRFLIQNTVFTPLIWTDIFDEIDEIIEEWVF
jgi:hypothetical protein